MATIANKTCVVTGGTRGIGRGLVEKLLSRGNRVIATGRSVAGAEERLAQLSDKHPGKLLVTGLDVADESSIGSWAAELQERHGIKHVDLLINNAGIYSPDGRRPQLDEFRQADFTPVFLTNAVGPFLVVQQLLRRGLLGPEPSSGARSTVVNVSSIMASHTDPTVSTVTPGAFSYRASKAALNIMTRTLANDFERSGAGVDCVLVHPGYVKTDMTGGSGWVEVEESTAGIMKLLEDGRPLNGRWYSYDGGEIPW